VAARRRSAFCAQLRNDVFRCGAYGPSSGAGSCIGYAWDRGEKRPRGQAQTALAGSSASAPNWPARRSQTTKLALIVGPGQRMHVHLVGAQYGAALADASQIQGRRLTGAAGDMQRVPLAIRVATHST
jgi:hypothetical protein